MPRARPDDRWSESIAAGSKGLVDQVKIELEYNIARVRPQRPLSALSLPLNLPSPKLRTMW
jgi:hypothetical protein